MSPLILHGGFEGNGNGSKSEQSGDWPETVSMRWELARQKLQELDFLCVPQQHPLRILVDRDLPQLLQKLRSVQHLR